ncbi:hypothetical protein Sango_0164100 [Sesamum angolense]|uniref:Uncharacterized protein n=1 Tax=Sesamum angolense TaxID=2727404 RepID=A0AAE1XGB6_9LAMI|nr:hypothetical protein Sango_0164100 [Sesamum angolense]
MEIYKEEGGGTDRNRKQWRLFRFQPHPTPAALFPYPETPPPFPKFPSDSAPAAPFPSSVNNPTLQILINAENQQQQDQNDPFTLKPTPFKRPHLQQQFSSSLTKTPTLSNALHRYGVSAQNPPTKFGLFYNRSQKFLTHFHHHLRHLRRRLRLHLRLILLLSLPFFYFLVSHPSSSFILDFLSAFAFSAALLFSLNLAIPRLPTIRLFLARSLPIKICAKDQVSRPHLPVFWSIGSRQKADKKAISGCYVQAYSNGDVYEGEFHKGKCSGSGVYYYYMSGRYEGDWVDGKYDGYGVETWARGSRYRGQYRQGLRHGFGVYRFYTGDVYAGEWSSGQSHGCGIHTCEDGSKYVGEFKWGVKHGLGHYHFRNGDRYAGEYFADKMHGFGVYCFANGHRYEVHGMRSNTYPVSPVAVNHSKVLNVVQEARRAAEKAYEVTKVDERVNRAVAAANRAANAARVAAVKAVQKQMHHRSNSDEIPIPVV